jgi:hypothetical protein
LLLEGCRDAKHKHRNPRRDVSLHYAEWAHARDPHHRRRGIADDAARAASVGGGHHGREITDVHLLEDVARNGSADQGGRDVVEEARQHEDDDQENEPAGPVVRQERRHFVGDAAFLEVARQHRKAHQQQKQIGERHPFMVQMERETAETGAFLEAGDTELVGGDDRKARERDFERPVMKQRDPKQGQAEQDEVDGNSEQDHLIDAHDFVGGAILARHRAKRHARW